MNLPYTCPPETISSGVAMANHVFLIADRHHAGHEWLYQPGHQLSTLARDNRVTVLTLGGQSKITTPDTIHLPPHRAGFPTAAIPLTSPPTRNHSPSSTAYSAGCTKAEGLRG